MASDKTSWQGRRGNNIREGGDHRDGGRRKVDNYVDEVVVEAKNNEEKEEEMNNL